MIDPLMETISREKELFFGALEVAPNERSQYLAAQCDGDHALRIRVDALLAADQNAGSFLASPTAGASALFAVGGKEFESLQLALAGRFSIEREVGRGGMGVVYLARDVALNRAVAVKVLPAEMADRTDYRARFLSEVRTAAGMTHPNIVPIHLVEEQGNVVCFVMSYVEGETLRQLVDRTGPLPAGDAAKVMQEVAWALAHAHERGIVHRDVKPDNILIERASGRALVTDFGIAAALDADGAMTMDGVFLGTPLFASPEQGTGHGIDPRSDVYSLGATMFFALTGRPVFDAMSATSALERHRSEPPPRVGSVRAELPRALSECVDRCLAKDRDMRFQSAEDLAKALTATVASAHETPEPIRRVVHETVQVTADIGGLLIFSLVGLAGWWLDQLTANGFLSELSTFVLLITLLAGGTFFVMRVSEAVVESRNALARGYSPSQLRRACLEPASRQRNPGRRRWSAILLGGFSLVTAGCWIWNYYSPIPDPPGFGDDVVFIVATFAPLIIGRLAIRDILLNDTARPGRLRRLSAALGGLIVRVASSGLRRRRAPDVVVEHTETILVGSSDALLGQLPTAFRDNLVEVPELLRRLENHADTLRARRDDIEQALAESGALVRPLDPGNSDGSAGGLLRSRMESDRASLVDAHESANARLGDVIAALESVRLGLLRLRAGVAVPADLTSDLALARKVGEQVDLLLLGAAEADRLTKQK